MHPYQCANCQSWHEGASLYLSTAPRDRYGRVTPEYRDDPATPVFCSEECRSNV